MTIEEARTLIRGVEWRGSRPGLSRVRELLHRIGDPQDTLQFVHIAGTNGKGSTAAMLAAVLQAAGYTTGLFTSPFLEQFAERMQVNGQPIPDAELAAACETLQPCIAAMDDQPTEFELVTAAAMLWFQRRGCDIVVLEVGLGGRLDATNVIGAPACAVITNIGDAHIEFLGSREGILKAKSEIFENLDADGVAILNGDDALLDTVALPQRIVRCGESAHADVRVSALRDRGIDGIACTVTTARAAYHLRIPAPGRHMIYAASLAAAVGEELGLSVPEIERGVALYEPAGSRMRVHRLSGDRRLLDDCYNANPQSMSAALRVLAASEGKKIAVLGDMKELGELTESAHRAMGELCALLGIDRVIAVGEYAHGIADAAHESVEWYPDAESAVDAARAAFTEGSVLLCKASHSMHLEKIVEELLKTT